VLEIGCGTGQATLSLLERGLDVLCVERGPRLAEVARRKGAAVEVARFEEWEPAERRFAAVVSFTAWHWLDPETKVERAARALRDAGAQVVEGFTLARAVRW
jgi:SAM-dependent methyltransferase